MTIGIVDTNHDVTSRLLAFEGLGIKIFVRYINPLGTANEKTVKRPEAEAIARAGKRLAVVCEGWGDFAHGGISAAAGRRDGPFCRDYAISELGAPTDGTATIYFAVDTDASAYQINELVKPYFAAIRAALGKDFRVGVYGSGAVCDAVKAAGLADDTWLSCSLGWDGSRAYAAAHKWTILQHLPQTIAGIDTDPDEASGPMGDFSPWNGVVPPAPPTVADIQKWLNLTGAKLAVDGAEGPATVAAVKVFQKSHGLAVDGDPGPATAAALKQAAGIV